MVESFLSVVPDSSSKLRCLLKTKATASGADLTNVPPSHTGQQVIPLKCSTTCLGSIPARKANVVSLEIPSSCAESQPPAFPTAIKTSNGSSFSS